MKDLVALLPRLRRFAMTLCPSAKAADEMVGAVSLRALAHGQPAADIRLDAWVYRLMRALRQESLVLAPESQSIEAAARIIPLPSGSSAAFLLVNVEKFSYEVAADILGIPHEAVMRQVAEARMSFAAQETKTFEKRA
ncbi:sigma factor [Xaviernesmea oryzae]|nr:sigma factor [Xaviernesmea oryzae]